METHLDFNRDSLVIYKGSNKYRALDYTYVWVRLDSEVNMYIIEHPEGLLPHEIINQYEQGKINDGFKSVYQNQLKDDLRFIKVERDEIIEYKLK